MSADLSAASPNLDAHVKVGYSTCMPAQAVAPTEAEVLAARAVLKALRLAQMRAARAARRAALPPGPKAPHSQMVPYLCGYCGIPFEGRASSRKVIGHWCGDSCRQLAWQMRKRLAAKREAARAAVLVGTAG